MPSVTLIFDLVFVLISLLLFFTYIGYPLALAIVSGRFSSETFVPVTAISVSVVIASRPHEHFLERKVRNIFESCADFDLRKLVVALDGSSETSMQMLTKLQQEVPALEVLELPALGKAAALNAGVELTVSDVVIFTDVRQTVSRTAVRSLLAPFSAPQVGAVTGILVVDANNSGEAVKTEIESRIRLLESRNGSSIGAAGAFYAVRRSLIPKLPIGTLLDDMYIPMHVIKQGFRVIAVADAKAVDRILPTPSQEFRRKVRTLTGNYQLVRHMPWLLSRQNPVWFRFFAHKLLRHLSPILLLILLFTSAMSTAAAHRFALAVQIVFYGAAVASPLISKGWLGRVCNLCFTFCLLNAAALVALLNFVRGREEVWTS